MPTWDVYEQVVICWADLAGVTASQLGGLLPGRKPQDIQNAFGILRAGQRGVCGSCRQPWAGVIGADGGQRLCPTCHGKVNEAARVRLKAGCCRVCGQPRGPGSSLSMCAACRLTRRALRKGYGYALGDRQSKSHAVAGLFPWLGTLVTEPLLSFISPGQLVVDLFGGSGRLLLAAAAQGHAVAYNDLHPQLAQFMKIILNGSDAAVQELREHIRLAQRSGLAAVLEHYHYGTPFAAACFYQLARAGSVHAGGCMRTGKFPVWPGPDRHFGATIRQWRELLPRSVPVTNLDYRDALKLYAAPGTCFLVDPPWIGSKCYEYGFEGRWSELVQALLSLPSGFVLTCASDQASLKLMKEIPYLYWVRIGPLGRQVIGSNRPGLSARLEPLVLADYGL